MADNKNTAKTAAPAPAPASVPVPAGGSLAVMTGGGNIGVTIGGKSFKVAKKVTMPLLKHPDNSDVAITILGPIYVGKELKNKRNGETVEKPADMCNVLNLETGEEMQYIVSAVVKGNLEETYMPAKEGDVPGYVGKSFVIRKGATVEGKRYKEFAILEIEAA